MCHFDFDSFFEDNSDNHQTSILFPHAILHRRLEPRLAAMKMQIYLGQVLKSSW